MINVNRRGILYAGLVDKAAAIINGLDVSEVTPRDAVSLADILDMCHIAGLPENWGALSKAMDAIVAGLPEATGQWQAPEETRALQETLKGIWRIGKRLLHLVSVEAGGFIKTR